MFFIPTLIAFLYEFYLGIPIIGGLTALSTGLGTVTVAFVIHIIVLILRFVTGHSKAVPIAAIILTCLTFIPVLAWLLHVIIALMYFIDLILGFVSKKNVTTYN